MLFACSIVLAFCSIVYELLLGQSLSAFLGDTVLRYSVTIGLYLLSLGIGTRLAERTDSANPLNALIKIELLLTLSGGSCVLLLFLVSYLELPLTAFSFIAHSLIILIGILTGYELPLLIAAANKERGNSDNKLIGLNYIGAFAGTLAFALWFYPTLGLIPSTFTVAFLNCFVGTCLCIRAISRAGRNEDRRWFLLGANLTLAAVLFVLFLNVEQIQEYLIIKYLEV